MPGHIVGPVPQAAASGCKCGMIFDHKAKGAKVVEQICMARSVAVRPELSLDRPVMIAMLASLLLVAIILLLVFEAGAKGEVCLLNKLLGMRERMLSKNPHPYPRSAPSAPLSAEPSGMSASADDANAAAASPEANADNTILYCLGTNLGHLHSSRRRQRP